MSGSGARLRGVCLAAVPAGRTAGRGRSGCKIQRPDPLPDSPGGAIESVISFTDNYGLGIPNYLYNVAHQSFDRILLCTETDPAAFDPQLLQALARCAPLTEVIYDD